MDTAGLGTTSHEALILPAYGAWLLAPQRLDADDPKLTLVCHSSAPEWSRHRSCGIRRIDGSDRGSLYRADPMPMVDQKFVRPPPVTVPRTFATIEARQKAKTPSLVVARSRFLKD